MSNFQHLCRLVFVLILMTSIGLVQAQNPARLTLRVNGQSLTAGFNNNVTLSVTNDFYSTIYDVDIAVSFPSPLTLIGDNHWYYKSIALGQVAIINFQVYAPTAGIGNSYQASVTATYRQLGDISYTEEDHAISFSVHGWINLILYNVLIAPSSAAPGGNATVSGSLLNSGNIAAYNANVTVESESVVPGSAANVYLGEIDPNIPRPFSLLVYFKRTLADGNYSIVIKVSAIDSSRPSSPYTAHQLSQIQIKKTIAQPVVERQRPNGLIGIILQALRYLFDVFFGSLNLVEPLGLTHSYFNATTAFILAARQAG